jgi:hypothetical protein
MDKMLISGLFETFWTFIQDIGCLPGFLKNFLKIENFLLAAEKSKS